MYKAFEAFDQVPSLTPRHAAKLLNLPTQTIRDMIKRNELPAIKVNGQSRITRSEIRKFISHSF
jgi:excisionase family DNA binding protein